MIWDPDQRRPWSPTRSDAWRWTAGVPWRCAHCERRAEPMESPPHAVVTPQVERIAGRRGKHHPVCSPECAAALALRFPGSRPRTLAGHTERSSPVPPRR